MISQLSAFAISTDTAVLPEAVGPQIIISVLLKLGFKKSFLAEEGNQNSA
jgi:hypothetical protein